jgi:hypothetical protein
MPTRGLRVPDGGVAEKGVLMGDQQFDNFVRAVSAGATRRRLLASLSSAIAGVVGVRQQTALAKDECKKLVNETCRSFVVDPQNRRVCRSSCSTACCHLAPDRWLQCCRDVIAD